MSDSLSIKTFTHRDESVLPRKVPMCFEEEVRTQIKILLERGLIEPTESRYTFPVALAKKKNGELRMCKDT